jgi:GTP-sensing pleiotropic transcriptional regulator CodY
MGPAREGFQQVTGRLLILVEQDLARANAFKNVALMVADVITAAVFIVAARWRGHRSSHSPSAH